MLLGRSIPGNATMSCFIDMVMFNNSYYDDFNVEIEDSHSLFSADPIVYQQRGRITIFKVSTTCKNFSYYTRYSFGASFTRIFQSQIKMSRQMDVRKAFETIKANHGFNFTLKDGQLKVLYTLLNGRDCAGVFPTGYGKSICYTR